jgi:signal transduction histidine kinase
LTLNLISNAIKFRREGVPPEVEISAEVLDGSVQITVADNGIGFEPQYSTRIFRVFERLHGRTEYPGTGIGLALCHKIVGRHGGRIVAESQLGEGATFTVTLPIEQIIDENELILDDQSEPVAKEQTSVLR